MVFSSGATNLVPGDANGVSDVFLRDLLRGTTERLTAIGPGREADGASEHAVISGDGRVVAFSSMATNLVDPSVDGRQVYVVDLGAVAPTFVDIASSPYADAILTLARLGVVSGYQVGDQWEFRPDNSLKRAQFAKMIVGALVLPVDEFVSSPFADLGPDNPDDLYPHEFVAAAYTNGITKGTSSTSFGPFLELTRAQLVTMVVRALRQLRPERLAEPTITWTGQLPDSDPTHGANLRAAEFNHLLDGISLKAWDIWTPASRGETAQILANMLEE